MSKLLDELKLKFPRFKVISEPDVNCSCKGSGERRTQNGHEFPCLCVCLSEIAGYSRADTVRDVGNAAKRIMKPAPGEQEQAK